MMYFTQDTTIGGTIVSIKEEKQNESTQSWISPFHLFQYRVLGILSQHACQNWQSDLGRRLRINVARRLRVDALRRVTQCRLTQRRYRLTLGLKLMESPETMCWNLAGGPRRHPPVPYADTDRSLAFDGRLIEINPTCLWNSPLRWLEN
jgi:hypothetical protein